MLRGRIGPSGFVVRIGSSTLIEYFRNLFVASIWTFIPSRTDIPSSPVHLRVRSPAMTMSREVCLRGILQTRRKHPLRPTRKLWEFHTVISQYSFGQNGRAVFDGSKKILPILGITRVKSRRAAPITKPGICLNVQIDCFRNVPFRAIGAKAGAVIQITPIDQSGRDTISGVSANRSTAPTIAVGAYLISRHRGRFQGTSLRDN